jgi:hypothetical protein
MQAVLLTYGYTREASKCRVAAAAAAAIGLESHTVDIVKTVLLLIRQQLYI